MSTLNSKKDQYQKRLDHFIDSLECEKEHLSQVEKSEFLDLLLETRRECENFLTRDLSYYRSTFPSLYSRYLLEIRKLYRIILALRSQKPNELDENSGDDTEFYKLCCHFWNREEKPYLKEPVSFEQGYFDIDNSPNVRKDMKAFALIQGCKVQGLSTMVTTDPVVCGDGKSRSLEDYVDAADNYFESFHWQLSQNKSQVLDRVFKRINIQRLGRVRRMEVYDRLFNDPERVSRVLSFFSEVFGLTSRSELKHSHKTKKTVLIEGEAYTWHSFLVNASYITGKKATGKKGAENLKFLLNLCGVPSLTFEEKYFINMDFVRRDMHAFADVAKLPIGALSPSSHFSLEAVITTGETWKFDRYLRYYGVANGFGNSTREVSKSDSFEHILEKLSLDRIHHSPYSLS